MGAVAVDPDGDTGRGLAREAGNDGGSTPERHVAKGLSVADEELWGADPVVVGAGDGEAIFATER